MTDKGLPKYPYQPFNLPVPPIPVLNEGEICFTIDRKFLPYIIGALSALEQPQTYEIDDPTSSIIEARNLITKFVAQQDDCGETCLEYPPSSSIVGWAPGNPYTQPDYIPDGYIAPPFMVIEESTPAALLTGLAAGDVVSGWLSLPVTTPALGEGLARFRVTVSGIGTVELHLLAIPAGGAALVVDDDDITTATTIDLNKDLVAVPPETDTVIIHERKFTTEGEHHIDVSFLPQFNDSEIFLGYGGGIRKLELCGFDDMSLDVRQNPTDNCILQKRNGAGEWVDFANISLCPPNLPKKLQPIQWRVVDGVTQWSQDGTTWYDYSDGSEGDFGQNDPSFGAGVDKACVAAKNIVATLRLQFNQIRDGLAVGAAFIGVLALITALILVFVTAGAAAPLVLAFVSEIMAVGAQGITINLNDAFWDDVECIIYSTIGEDGLFSAAEYGAFYDGILGMSGDGRTILTMLTTIYGPTGLNNMVNGAGITDCGHVPCDDSVVREYDYTQGPQGAVPATWYINTGNVVTPYPASEWVFGRGWQWTDFSTLNGSSRLFFNAMSITFTLPADASFAAFEIDYHLIKGTGGSVDNMVTLHIAPAAGSVGESVFALAPFRQDYIDGDHTLHVSTSLLPVNKLYTAGSIIRMSLTVMNLQGYANPPAVIYGEGWIKKLRLISV